MEFDRRGGPRTRVLRGTTCEELRVALDITLVVFWHVAFFVDGLGWAHGEARAAVDAFVRVNEELEIGEAGGA